MDFILDFEDLDEHSLILVGGKNASLGEMIRAGINVPPGFALTTDSYQDFITGTGIKSKILKILSNLNQEDINSINKTSAKIQKLIKNAPIPGKILDSIKKSYAQLSKNAA